MSSASAEWVSQREVEALVGQKIGQKVQVVLLADGRWFVRVGADLFVEL